MNQASAFGVFHMLLEAEKAFRSTSRELGWSLLEQAEQHIPQVEDRRLFAKAQAHANRVWKLACNVEVAVLRDERAILFGLVSDAEGQG